MRRDSNGLAPTNLRDMEKGSGRPVCGVDDKVRVKRVSVAADGSGPNPCPSEIFAWWRALRIALRIIPVVHSRSPVRGLRGLEKLLSGCGMQTVVDASLHPTTTTFIHVPSALLIRSESMSRSWHVVVARPGCTCVTNPRWRPAAVAYVFFFSSCMYPAGDRNCGSRSARTVG